MPVTCSALESLPDEILLSILGYFAHNPLDQPPCRTILFPGSTPRHDLYNICLTSRELRRVAQDLLETWRLVPTISTGNRFAFTSLPVPSSPDLAPILRPAPQAQNDDRKLRTLTFGLPKYDRIDHYDPSCPHEIEAFPDWEEWLDEWTRLDEWILEHLGGNNDPTGEHRKTMLRHVKSKCRSLFHCLLPIVKSLSIGDNQLTSFVWTLGSCIPPQILGKGGWLSCTQSGSIKSLHLNTPSDCLCNRALDGYCDPHLAPFWKLESLSWTNCYTESEIRQAALAIRGSARRLQSLDISLRWGIYASQPFGDPEDFPPYPNRSRLDDLLLPLGRKGPATALPALTTLSLVEFNLEDHDEHLVSSSFDWAGNLVNLTLRECKGLPAFLRTLSRLPLNLETCDIRVVEEQYAADDEVSITNFLQSFSGRLRELTIDFEPSYRFRKRHAGNRSCSQNLTPGVPSIWTALAGHRATLRRLSYSRLRWQSWFSSWQPDSWPRLGLEGVRYCDTEMDDSRVCPPSHYQSTGEVTVASLPKLEVMSLAFRPDVVSSVMLPACNSNVNNSIKLLQIRRGYFIWSPSRLFYGGPRPQDTRPVHFGLHHNCWIKGEKAPLCDLLDTLFDDTTPTSPYTAPLSSLKVVAYGDVLQMEECKTRYPLFFIRRRNKQPHYHDDGEESQVCIVNQFEEEEADKFRAWCSPDQDRYQPKPDINGRPGRRPRRSFFIPDHDEYNIERFQSRRRCWEWYRPRQLGGTSPDDPEVNRIIMDNMDFLRSNHEPQPGQVFPMSYSGLAGNVKVW